jgi:uncharacterized protein (DUF952 family)
LILHLCTRDEWAAALIAGTYEAATLASQGFIHCSTEDQVHVPATALFCGRLDMVLLEIDESRLPVPIVWEKGDPPHPDGWLFPHLYAPLPAAAVISTRAYVPEADGSFSRNSFTSAEPNPA